jgi:hypothetical protein
MVNINAKREPAKTVAFRRVPQDFIVELIMVEFLLTQT